MKIVLNKCYGGFSLSEFACEKLGCNPYDYTDIDKMQRISKRLIDLVEMYGSEKCSGGCAALVIVEVPDETTDWEINEYDGLESVTYVIDGKIHHA